VPEALVSMLWTLEEQEQARREALAGFDTFEVVYEDDLADTVSQQRTVDRLCDWLRLPSARVASSFERRSLSRLEDRIANYPAVARTLAATRYHHLLDDIPVTRSSSATG
jgi:hypothetical protein